MVKIVIAFEGQRTEAWNPRKTTQETLIIVGARHPRWRRAINDHAAIVLFFTTRNGRIEAADRLYGLIRLKRVRV